MTISGTKQPRRPDIICFINGIPLAVVELKSPVDDKVDIWDAYHQLQTYKDRHDLFISNEALIVSDGYLARVGVPDRHGRTFYAVTCAMKTISRCWMATGNYGTGFLQPGIAQRLYPLFRSV